MEKKKFVIKICLLGEANVGKTSLVYRFVENKFREDYKSTLGVNLLKKDIVLEEYGKVSAQIWDLGGQESFKSLRKLYLEGANGALLVYDTTKRKTYEKLSEWMNAFKEARGIDKPLVLIGNKVDLKDKIAVSEKEGADFAKANNTSFLLTSAKTGEGVEESFKNLIKNILDRVSV